MTPIPKTKGVHPDLERAIALWEESEKGTSTPPTFRLSPLDKNAHLRRTVEEHHEIAQAHQVTLEKHDALHKLQAEARARVKQTADAALERADFVSDRLAQHVTAYNAINRSVWSRLRWLITGA